RIVLETPSLSVLRAALEAGLALSCRTEVFSKRVLVRDDLPTLPQVAYVRHVRPEPHAAVKRLADLITAAVDEL
ncbi:MAG: LysR family transcriptional regulator, partial [Caulobacteraceae bacterium]|nr:LysR family transcriptional regulator [Caulobacteraceae bacterium]